MNVLTFLCFLNNAATYLLLLKLLLSCYKLVGMPLFYKNTSHYAAGLLRDGKWFYFTNKFKGPHTRALADSLHKLKIEHGLYFRHYY